MANKEKNTKAEEFIPKLEEEIETMTQAKCKSYLDELAGVYNQASIDADEVTMIKVDIVMKNVLARHNDLAWGAYSGKVLNEANPMLTACRDLFYPVLKIKDDKDGKLTTRSVEHSQAQVKLAKLNGRGKPFGAETSWYAKVEILNKYMTARAVLKAKYGKLDFSNATDGDKETVAKVLKELDGSFAMSKVARKIANGGTPLSNTQMLKYLQEVVTSMLGTYVEKDKNGAEKTREYKAKSHDLGYLDVVFGSADKKSARGIKGAKSGTDMMWFMANICNRAITNGEYSVLYASGK